ncbi:hypothetical protein [Azospirillum rugosum]|uniref:Helix-turn-helix domain-containing protein n=1 Tax=Azospirillum rugosum TaxID=416170 RepID=A0ABS4SQ87_9PROT|nr:hypothetical protein [Azospirillum rugosum]MBP2294710.1 hypothetical protein [Azospirillum rugosum]MDQ0528001.1 hypothetical protein [Azospirillum rugosum]
MLKKPRRSRSNATGRNETVRFIALPHYMLKCPAWRALSPNAKALLIDVWQRHNGANNGEIAYAVREAEGIGISRSSASRAFGELVELGFLKQRKASTFTLKTKEASTWELTAERFGDATPSKDFMRWQPAQRTAVSNPTGNKTQSHQRDPQSHQRDMKQGSATTLPVSVPPAGPSSAVSGSSQSHQRDTYNLPCGDGAEGRGMPAVSVPAPANDDRQLDLERWLDGLRGELRDHVEHAPPGELQRIADRIGLSRPQLANFKSGRRSLAEPTAQALRDLLKAG